MTTTGPSGDGASAMVYVAVPCDEAFEVFTKEIDAWWRTGPRYRIAGKRRGELFFEPGPNGRVFETFEMDSGASKTFEIGKVLVWDPPNRLELEWRLSNFKADEKTFVEVSFVPQGEGTRVSVRHYGFAALRPGHPARHGMDGAAFSRTIGMWWGSLMTSLREHVEEK